MNTNTPTFETTGIGNTTIDCDRDERAEGNFQNDGAIKSPVKQELLKVQLETAGILNLQTKNEKHDMSALNALTNVAVKEEDEDDDKEEDEEDEEEEEEGDMDQSQDAAKLDADGNPSVSKSTTKRRRRGEEDVPMTFPQRLMEILSSEEDADIISWLPHGRGFMIYQKKRFAAEIMPKYFKQSKFTSFTRKLNRWNFTRITRGPETGAYYHEYFQRGNLRLCMQMCCQNSKNAAVMQSMSARPGVVGMSPLLGPRSVGDAMNRLRLGPAPDQQHQNDLSSMSLLQSQLGAAAAQAGGLSGLGGSGDENLMKLRQLEQQRELLLQQQQQQQFQQQFQQQQLQQQQQQQQLAALGLGRAPTNLLGGNNGPSQGQGGTPDMGLGALQRGNANAYLAMIMAQEKVQAQMASLGGGNSFNPVDFQRQQTNLLHSQQQQLEQYKMLQAQAAYQQGQAPSCNDMQSNLLGSLLQQPGLMPGQDSNGQPDERGKIKRGASAA